MRTGYKFWGVVKCLNRSKKKPQVYTTSDHYAGWYDVGSIVPATEEEIIEYNKETWDHSEEYTRNAIATAKKLVKS